VLRVSTQKPWNRDAFFAWLEGRPGKPGVMAQKSIPHVQQLAEMAGMHPSTLSRWRKGSRPTVDKLTAVARVLGVKRRDILLVAGLLDEADLTTVEGRPESEELSAEERAAVAMIEASGLSAPLKKRLIADHLEEARRAREERERQLRSKIELLETT
jgi:transcriptional regulator with XRE-family HTH domain